MRGYTRVNGFDSVSSSEAAGGVCAQGGVQLCAGRGPGREASIGSGRIVQRSPMASGIDFHRKRFWLSWGDRGRGGVRRFRSVVAGSPTRESKAHQEGETK